MATRWAVQNGNWSDTATWNGGTLPASNDDVFADGKTVTIDQNILVNSLRTTTRSGGIAGGGFTMNSPYNITATQPEISNGNLSVSGIIPGATNCVTFTGSGSITIQSSLRGGNNIAGYAFVSSGANANITIIGNVTSGGFTGASGYAISLTGASPVLNITGAVQHPISEASATYAIFVASTATNAIVSITGNVIAAKSTNSVIFSQSALLYLTIIGDIISSTTNNAITISTSGTSSQVVVTGNVSGSNSQSAVGIDSTGSQSLVTVTGSVQAGSGQNAHGITSSATTFDSGVIIYGNLYDSSTGTVAVYARRLRVVPNWTGITRYADTNQNPVSRVSVDSVTGTPSISNVRQGTVYGYNNELTGTLAVPSANQVAAGIPVDNTVGTAAVRLEDIAAVTGAQIAAAITNANTI